MNKGRRERIEKLRDQITTLKGELEEVRDEEQNYYDNMPEPIQNGSKGEAAQGSIDVLEDAINSLDEAEDYLGNVEVTA
jgi:prefoldin subunit 5